MLAFQKIPAQFHAALSSWAQHRLSLQFSWSSPVPAIAAFRDSSFFFRSSMTSRCSCCIFSNSCSSVLFSLPAVLVLLQKHKDWDIPFPGYRHISGQEHAHLWAHCRSTILPTNRLFRKYLLGFYFLCHPTQPFVAHAHLVRTTFFPPQN